MLRTCFTAGVHPGHLHASGPTQRWRTGSRALAVAWLLMPMFLTAAEAASSSRQRRVVPAAAVATARAPDGARRMSLVRQVPQARRGLQARRAPQARRVPQARQVPAGAGVTHLGWTLDTVRLALEDATRATGLDRGVLQRIAERESRLNPTARSRSSSATGLMQFTRDTWLEVVRDFGPRHGLASEAAALQTGRDGRIEAQDPRTLQRILLLRESARYSAVLAAERLRAARPGLEGVLGRAATPADLYLVHLLGNTGSRRFLAALRDSPRRASLAVLGEPARANPGVFERNGESLPVARAYEELAVMFEAPLLVAVLSSPQPY